MDITLARVHDLHASIHRLQQAMAESHDEKTAAQLDTLLARGDAPQVLVALVGLFSAGKSTLVNYLCHSSLATGAVPTTADVARIALPGTEQSVWLLDTPGVDSTDDAHRRATEDALYEADVVCLVMDYQHVEADENLELAAEFAQGAKRLVLVVNQVDKHLDFELPFTVFQDRVLASLSDWDITYERIFYTATRPSPHNQVEDLQAWLQGLASGDRHGAEDAGETLAKRIREVIEDHVSRQMHPQWDDKVQAAAERFDREVITDAAARSALLQRITQELAQTQASLDASQAGWQDALKAAQERFTRMVELAQIAPYDTTEMGRRYVESLRAGFKTGWLNQKAKTQAERAARLASFLKDLQDHVERFLCWAVQGELRAWIQSESWLPASCLSEVDSVSVTVTDALCQSVLNQGAVESEHYLYQFVKDVTAKVKGQFLSALRERLTRFGQAADAQWRESHADELERLQSLEADRSLLQPFETWDREYQERVNRYWAVLTDTESPSPSQAND